MTDTLIIQLIAWLYLSVSAGILINHNQYKKLFENLLGSRAFMFLFAVIAFFVGFVLVSTHNTWGLSWQNSVVSAIGWIILIKSVLVLVFPSFSAEVGRIINYQKHLTIIASILGIVGIILIFLTQ